MDTPRQVAEKLVTGISQGRFEEVPVQDYSRLVDINLKGVIYGSVVAIRQFRDEVDEARVETLEAGRLRVGDVAGDVLKREGLRSHAGDGGGEGAENSHNSSPLATGRKRNNAPLAAIHRRLRCKPRASRKLKLYECVMKPGLGLNRAGCAAPGNNCRAFGVRPGPRRPPA